MQNMNVGRDKIIFREPTESTSWSINYTRSSIRFLVKQRNLIARPFRTVHGEFRAYTGFIQTGAEDFTNADINFSILVNSIATGNAKRDKHLLSADFFDGKKFSSIKFHSISFERKTGRSYILGGNLTIKGITKRHTLEVLYEGTIEDESGSIMASFNISTRINRHDFGIRSNLLGNIFIKKEVTVICHLEFTRMAIRIL